MPFWISSSFQLSASFLGTLELTLQVFQQQGSLFWRYQLVFVHLLGWAGRVKLWTLDDPMWWAFGTLCKEAAGICLGFCLRCKADEGWFQLALSWGPLHTCGSSSHSLIGWEIWLQIESVWEYCKMNVSFKLRPLLKVCLWEDLFKAWWAPSFMNDQ